MNDNELLHERNSKLSLPSPLFIYLIYKSIYIPVLDPKTTHCLD